jgi:hypothetical protein
MYKKLTRQQANRLEQRTLRTSVLTIVALAIAGIGYGPPPTGAGVEAHSGPAPGVFAASWGLFPGEKWPIPAPTGHDQLLIW